MLYLITISGLFLFTNCGRGLASSPVDHGVFEPYFQQFEQGSILEGRSTFGDSSIVIEFGTMEGDGQDVVGECQYYLQNRKVVIDEQYWNSASENERTVLILHELGHCILNLQHDTKMIVDRSAPVPESIMYPYILTDWEYVDLKSHYIAQLFGR